MEHHCWRWVSVQGPSCGQSSGRTSAHHSGGERREVPTFTGGGASGTHPLGGTISQYVLGVPLCLLTVAL